LCSNISRKCVVTIVCKLLDRWHIEIDG
jgi:hypothetical protein